MNRTALLLPLILLLPACASGPGEPDLRPAAGVSIQEIAIYQGVKRTLVADGEPVDSEVPLIQGRQALLRVFVETDGDYDGGPVTGRLTLGDEVIEVVADDLPEESRDHRMESTVNFDIDGALLGATMDWSVELLQEDGGGDEAARYPASGTTETAFEGRANVLRLVIAPFSYEFDGSGRLPDLGDEQVERIRDRFLGMFPVSDVQIRVRDPEPWYGELKPNGDGWYGVGFQLLGFRDEDGESDDAYFYGIFDPAASFGAYCNAGCLLGVTLLNDEPEDVGNVSLRIALGVGFAEQAAETAAHEIGHAHGRPHSPCGPPGNVPADIDPDYPYSDGTVGVWGYDITSGDLHEPDEATDFMGYCDDAWVSDFTYRALHRRGTNVNAAPELTGTFSYDLYSVQGDTLTHVRALDRDHPVSGRPVQATAFSDGHARSAEARYVPWDHIDGGVLLVPRGELQTDAVEAVVEGRFVRSVN